MILKGEVKSSCIADILLYNSAVEFDKQINRRDFLKLAAAGTLSLFINPEIVKADSENKPYVAQKTWESCGYACMAMIISEVKNEDPENVLERISDYYELIGKYDFRLGDLALKDYFERIENISVVSDRKRWNLDSLTDQLHKNGSTIVDVTSNYIDCNTKYPANHWVIVDDIVDLEYGSHALVRDPLRSTEKYEAKKTLTPFMKPADGGSIYVPASRFVPALGEKYLYLDNVLDGKVQDNTSSLNKILYQ